MTINSGNHWTTEALENGNVEAIRQRTLEDVTYLQSPDAMGNTPLQTAIEFDHLDLVQFLLRQGADPNVKVDDGYTCLLTAIESNAEVSVEIVAALIEAGADIHAKGTNGWTALHMAAAYGQVSKARLLLDAGAHVNERTEIDAEETPLMEAAFAGRPEAVQLLLDHGADPTLRDTIHRRTALETAQYASQCPDANIYQFLKKENLRLDVDELFGDENLTPDLIQSMREHIHGVELAESYLESARQNKESGNHAEVIRILLKNSAHKTVIYTQRLHQLLFAFSLVGLSWLAMMAVHELGHVLGAWITGGTVERVVLRPLAISRTDVSPNPSPAIVVWLGPIVGCLLPLAMTAVIPKQFSILLGMARFFAGFCLVANGVYISIGLLERVGDCGEMLRTGTPPWTMITFGAVTVPTGLSIWHRLGSFKSFLQNPGDLPAPIAYAVSGAFAAIVVTELVFSSQ